MEGVVQAQTPHCADVAGRKRRQQEADVDDLVAHVVFPKDVASDDAGALGLGDVAHALGQNGVSIVGAAVLGQEAYKSLWISGQSMVERGPREAQTEKMAIFPPIVSYRQWIVTENLERWAGNTEHFESSLGEIV